MKNTNHLDMVNMSITNKCILRCPSCPTGRKNQSMMLAGDHNKLKYMPIQMCDDIFEKVKSLYGKHLFYLHIWNEPLLHPDIVCILERMNKYGHTAYISTSCNVHTDFEGILKSPALQTLVISMSGIKQEIYQKGHRGGNIDLVLKNLGEIGKYTQKASAKVIINWHEYKDNISDREKLKLLCEEKHIRLGSYPGVILQNNIMDEVLNDNLDSWKSNNDIIKLVHPRVKQNPFPFCRIHGLEDIPCHSQTNILVLDYDGQICTCTHREPDVVERLGNFLDMSLDEIKKKKLDARSCKTCRSLGLHMQYVFACFFFKPCKTEQDLVDFLRSPCQRYEKNIYIFGAGMTGAAVGPLLRHHGFNVISFIDDSKDKIGKNLHGIPVTSWADSASGFQNALIIDTVRGLPSKRRLDSKSLCTVVSPEDFIAAIMN